MRNGTLRISILLLAGFLCIATPAPQANITTVLGQTKAPRKISRYVCPMHPQVVSTKPGRCPKCGMRLRLIEDPAKPSVSDAKVAPSLREENSVALKIPNARVYDQDGNQISFYNDLVKGKVVAINFIF